MHVLIVDDDEGTRRAYARLLQTMGHTTCWAGNAVAALGLMRSEAPALVLLDIDLGPNMPSGWDVAFEKLKRDDIRAIPVIVLTGLDIDQARSPLTGAMLVLQKPVKGSDLERAIIAIENRTR